MENNNLVQVKPEELEVVDGKVIISSEELASAIQNYDFDLACEEEAQGFHIKYGICLIR